jgi:uncharacterized membrane protein (UPF0182 family)
VADVSPRRRRRSLRVTLVVVAVLIVILVLSLRSIATFYTDYLWFREVGHTSVFWKTLTAKLGLGAIFGALFFALVWGNLYIADRIAPDVPPMGPEEDIVGRYRDAVVPYRRWIRLGIAGVLGFFVGTAAVSHWSEWLLFLNRTDFGVKDPQFGKDVGFLVFQLPFYEFLVNWFLASLIFVTLITAFVHYINGGIRFQVPPRRERVAASVKVHLSVLFGVLALFKGAGYYLNQFELLYSERGFPFSRGAGATDVNAQLPALRLLVIIMVVIAAMFIVNSFRRGWILPVAALSMWILVAFIFGGLIPLGYQRFKVQPQEATAEQKFIDRNIAFTRLAYNFDPQSGPSEITVTAFAGASNLTPAEISDNAVTVKNVRVWDPKVLPDNYQQLQSLRNFYSFDDVDVDRYFFAVTDSATGRVRQVPQQVLLGVRELKPSELPSRSWVNLHLQFTHGYGVVMSEANTVVPGSQQPNFLLQNIPVQTSGTPAQNNALQLSQARVYFGQGAGDYAIVGTGQREFDYPVQETASAVETTYDGQGGVPLSNIFLRSAFALRFANLNPLISGQINSGSRILFHRDLADRVHTLAPFLSLDHDPYPAIVNGRLVWIQDAYTVTGNYPYAQVADLSRVPNGPYDLKNQSRVNYIRNSVKVTVDAFDGTITMWVVDPSDPIVQSYAKIFPGLFTFDQPPADLRSHFRYPEDLFRVQSDLYGQYHVTDAGSFYRQEDPWAIPQNPSEGLTRTDQGVSNDLMEPYYLLMRIPGDPSPEERFVIVQPFTPKGKGNMVSLLVARSDPEGYGRFYDFRLPKGSPVEGPFQVFARINQDQKISSDKSLLNQQGSKFIQGNLLLIPVGQSILYVQPIYVQSSKQGSQLPQLNRVVVVYGDRVVQGPTLDDAITQLFGLTPVSPTSPSTTTNTVPGTTTPGTTTGTVPAGTGTAAEQARALLQQAQAEYAAAQDALMRGDLAGYQQHIQRAQDLTAQALALLTGSAAPPSATGTATPGASGAAGPSG